MWDHKNDHNIGNDGKETHKMVVCINHNGSWNVMWHKNVLEVLTVNYKIKKLGWYLVVPWKVMNYSTAGSIQKGC